MKKDKFMETMTDWKKLQSLQVEYNESEKITIQNFKPNALFILVSGRLKVFRDDVLISTIKNRGDYIGEIACLLKANSSATVQPETNATLIEIKANLIDSFLTHSPDIAISIAKKMAERLVDLNTKFASLIPPSYIPEISITDPIESKQESINLEKLKPLYSKIQKDTLLTMQGEYPNSLYILVEGTIEIVKNGKMIAIENKPGYYIGDVAILRNAVSNGTARAATDCTVISVPIYRVESFLSHSPEIAISIARKLAERTITINDQYLAFQANVVKNINSITRNKKDSVASQKNKMDILRGLKNSGMSDLPDLDEILDRDTMKSLGIEN